MTRKSFSGAAVPTYLSTGIGSTDSSFSVASISNWPNTATGPFVVTVDRGLSAEEKILCSAYNAGTGAVTVASSGRGYDGTTAQTHTSSATVNCTLDAVTIDSHDAFVAGNGTVTPASSAIGDLASAGNSTVPAAANHKHAREQFTPAIVSASAPGDTASDGSSSSPARADHKHAREAAQILGTTVSTSAVGDTSAAGVATTPSKSDHVHGRESFGATVTASAPGDTTNAGAALTPARSDHMHAREAVPTKVLLYGVGAAADTQTPPAYGANFLMQAGKANVVSNAGGTITIPFPRPFPTGCLSFVATAQNASLGTVVRISATNPNNVAAFVDVFSQVVTGGNLTGLGSVNCVVSWIAVGW